MRKKTPIIISLILLVSCLANVSFVQAQGRRLQKRQERFAAKQERFNQKLGKRSGIENAFGGGAMMRVWARALKLNEEQIFRMRQIMRASGGNYINLEVQMRDKRAELDQAIFSENLNEEALKQMLGELTRLEGQALAIRTRVQVQIRNVLTPEQLKLYNELRFGTGRGFLDDEKEEIEKAPPTNTEKSNN
jgi:Spy/CpxP family protein refolding chaperone